MSYHQIKKIPVLLDNLWMSSVSKTAFQIFFAKWLTSNHPSAKPLYIGISPQAWVVSNGHASPFARLNCTHEGADDLMMFHIQDILGHRAGNTNITVLSSDTDVFVCLMYHMIVNWKMIGRALACSNLKRILLPLHNICTTLGDELTKCLPALHALTGTDSTSKISTKLAALNAVRKPDNIDLIVNLNCTQLTQSAIHEAEIVLSK